jgi:uncharacterized protein (UPF0264 family)
VRDAAEARIALAGGVNVIDIKEPRRGALGSADADVIAAIVVAVAGRVPISAAAGELLDTPTALTPPLIAALSDGVAFVKWGLAGCAEVPNWPARWQAAIHALDDSVQPVAVVYADWQAARAPAPEDVLALATEFGSPALLVDTWSKSVGDLFDRWPAERLAEFAARVRAAGIHLVLAGSLRERTLAAAVACRPTLVAVRGAVCDADRGGMLSPARLQAFRAALDVALDAAALDTAQPLVT